MAAVKLVKLDEYNPDLNKTDSPPPAPYARKSDRACDFCRRRKTRCDGALTLGSKCTNCRRNQCPCAYQWVSHYSPLSSFNSCNAIPLVLCPWRSVYNREASRPRGPPKAWVGRRLWIAFWCVCTKISCLVFLVMSPRLKTVLSDLNGFSKEYAYIQFPFKNNNLMSHFVSSFVLKLISLIYLAPPSLVTHGNTRRMNNRIPKVPG